MALRRKRRAEMHRADVFPPGWEVPASFNFTRDVIESLAARDTLRKGVAYVDAEGIVDRRTFADIAKDAARWAHLLRTRLDRGDRVLVVLGKVPAWHGAMLGAIKGGLVAVPCSDMLRARDLAFRVRDSGARLVVADRSSEAEIEEMRNQVDGRVTVVYLDECLAELQRYVPRAPTEDTTADEDALILYTSGTTREPKGVVHSHAYTWAQRAQAAHWLDAGEGDVVWCTAGTGWAKSIWNVLLGPWSHGAEVVVHEGPFDPEERLSLVERLGVTVLCQAPTEYRMLAKLEGLGAAYLPRLRHAVSAGEPLNPEVIERFEGALGVTIHDGYGQTENSLLVANAPGTPVRAGSMGLPTPGHEVAVIDDAGHVCPPGVEGDIALRGRPPTLFSGYWNAREATDAAFRDGWYVTGDRATRDEEGYLWFVGRADDVILSAAYRIGPFEVESALLEHPAVAESAVIGVPHAERGQIVKAFVVLRPGHGGDADLATELQDHVKAITAPYKYPRAIEFVDSLPKTASGKIKRAELRARPHVEAPETSSVVQLPIRRRDEDAARREAESRARAAAEAEAAAAAAREAEERARAEAAATAAREAEERARAEAEAEAKAAAAAARVAEERTQAEAAATAAREAEERARAEAEERGRAEAEASAAREAEERARAEAEATAEAEAEAKAEAAAAAREAEERARAEAAATAAREDEERARAEAEEAARREDEERARAEEKELVRIEPESTDPSEAEDDERARAQAEEIARVEAEIALHREAADRARLEARAAEAARKAAELQALSAESIPDAPGLVTDTQEASGRRARRAEAKEERAAAKRLAAEAKQRAKEDAEQRKRDEADAKARAKEQAAAAEARAKQAAAQAKLDAEAERKRAKDNAAAAERRAREEAEQRKRDEAAAREEARRRAEEEKAAEQKRQRRGEFTRFLFGGDDPDEQLDDDAPVEPIPGLVERLQRYAGQEEIPLPPDQFLTGPAEPAQPVEDGVDHEIPLVEDEGSTPRSRSH